MVSCFTGSSSVPRWTRRAHLGVRCSKLFRKLQVLQSKCLRIATGALWSISSRNIYDNLGFPFFADHIRALVESFDTKLADASTLFTRQLDKYLRWPRANLAHLKRKRSVLKVSMSRLQILPPRRIIESRPAGTFRLPLLRLFCEFSAVLRRKPGCNSKEGARLTLPLRHGGFTKEPAPCRFTSAATTPCWVQTPEILPTKVSPPHALN
jgi:hypothetical protein